MNILTRQEGEDEDEEWKNNECYAIEFEKTKDLVRTWLKDKNGDISGPGKLYYKLRFKY